MEEEKQETHRDLVGRVHQKALTPFLNHYVLTMSSLKHGEENPFQCLLDGTKANVFDTAKLSNLFLNVLYGRLRQVSNSQAGDGQGGRQMVYACLL